ncbi:MAG: GNAT family N-acetyltransferase [Angustibacter sp.]
MTTELAARSACVSATWTPQQRLHVGNVAWSHSRGDGSPVPDVSLNWGDPLQGFADVWHGTAVDDPAEVSLHVSPETPDGERSRLVHELLDTLGRPAVQVEVSRQDAALVQTLARAGFREQDGPWFAQLWRSLDDLSDLDRHRLAPGYRITAVDPTDPERLRARVEIHRRAWAPTRIKGLLGLEVTGDEPGSSYSLDKQRAVMQTAPYRPELDLMAVDGDGVPAAYALGWLDPVSRSLLFEPVGTDPRHAQRGLARALCAELLRVARRAGATQAVVGPRGDSAYPLPRRLYEGLGMVEVAQFVVMTTSGDD